MFIGIGRRSQPAGSSPLIIRTKNYEGRALRFHDLPKSRPYDFGPSLISAIPIATISRARQGSKPFWGARTVDGTLVFPLNDKTVFSLQAKLSKELNKFFMRLSGFRQARTVG